MTDSDGILADPTERIGPTGCIGRGLWVGVCLQTTPTPHPSMARRKSKTYKQLSLVDSENIGHTGAFAVLAKLEKQQGAMRSAYIEKIRISYILDVTDTSADATPLLKNLGLVWTVCTDSGNPATGKIVSASGSRGNGGVVTLDVRRRIVDNDYDADSGVGALALGVESTNPDLDTGDVYLKAYIEVWGRWHILEDA